MNRYGLEFTTSLDDNCNAIRFFGLRIEHAPLLIRFAVPESYDYAKHSPGHRQIDFFGLKAEQGAATNWSELALLNFGHCTGIHFHGGGVVRSQWERVGQQENPYTVESAAQIVTAENPLKVVTFSHVEFNTPGERAMLVARGSHLVFDDCTFQDVASVAATRPVFDLVDTSRVVGGTLRFARTMSDQPGLVPHANLARFSGRGSQLRGLAVSVPAGLHGTELRVEASAVENVFVRGSVSGAFTIPVDASATPLDGRLTMYEISGTAVLSSPAPSVFGLCWAELLSGVYLGFEHGTRDQVITLLGASGQSVALFTSATLRLRDGVSRTLRSDEAVTLRRCAGFWAEVG